MKVTFVAKGSLRFLLIASLFILTASFGNGDKKNKSSAKCTGSRSCNACKNCNYCKHCNSGGVCGVCSPESFEPKKKESAPKPKSKPKTTTKKKQ